MVAVSVKGTCEAFVYQRMSRAEWRQSMRTGSAVKVRGAGRGALVRLLCLEREMQGGAMLSWVENGRCVEQYGGVMARREEGNDQGTSVDPGIET